MRFPRDLQRRHALTALIPLLALLTAGGAGASVLPSRAGVAVAGALHLRLEKSEPSNGQLLAASPTVLRLWFSLPPEMGITVVRLTDGDGKAISLGKPRRGPGAKDPVEVDVKPPLAAGSYKVSWKTSSRDGHPISGDFHFSVKAAAN